MNYFKLSIVAVLGTAFFLSGALAKDDDCVTPITPMSADDMKTLNEVMHRLAPKNSTPEKDYATHPLDGSEFETEGNEIGMQMGFSGNPDVDKGKPFREQGWVISVLYPVEETDVGGVPTTVYVEVRCHSLGKQPESAYTDNINVRCGPGAVADMKLTDWLSGYVRAGIITSRFSHNGAPIGQINPKTGRQFRDYANDTWFTGAAMGAGIKIKLDSDTVLFGEYTKYKVQQTDNPAYQFRGAYTAGIARNFWLFQSKKD